MTTAAVAAPVSGRQAVHGSVNRTAEHIFYGGMSVLLCVCVVALAVPIGMTPAWHARAALLDRTIGPYL